MHLQISYDFPRVLLLLILDVLCCLDLLLQPDELLLELFFLSDGLVELC